MAIKDKKPRVGKITVDLTSPQGNAYWLIGYAKKLGKQLELDTDKIEKEMTSGDYENLIQVFDSYFGEFVDLER
jgi:hypothetical protein